MQVDAVAADADGVVVAGAAARADDRQRDVALGDCGDGADAASLADLRCLGEPVLGPDDVGA